MKAALPAKIDAFGSLRIVSRRGLAALLLPIFRPTHAKAAIVNDDSLTLRFASKNADVPFSDVEEVKVERGWFGSAVRIRIFSGVKVLSGLAPGDTYAFAATVEEARIRWWQRLLATDAELLRTVYSGVTALADPPRYIAMNVFLALERGAQEVAARIPSRYPDQLSPTNEIQMLKPIRQFLADPSAARARANAVFVANELVRSKEFLDSVEARPLTAEQRRAVVIDEDRNLVVAAAGSGKTSVIVAKAGWLLRKGYRRPSELLLLAYAKDAQLEMEERVRSRLGEDSVSGLAVRTFHGLGVSIIGEAEGKRPMLAKVAEDDKAMFDLLKAIIKELLADRKFSSLMVTWFECHFAPYRSEMDFKNQGEYWDYIRANEIRSLNGEKLKSYEECEIANFLYLNGIPYEYERPYEHDTASSSRRQYQPDFYLPDTGIYIEHFALSASGKTPPFIDQAEYLRSMEWKRRLHTERGTILIETFSHEKAAGKLTENLAEKLAAHGVVLAPIPAEEVFAVLERQGRVDTFTRLVATFLQHFKGGQLTLAEVEQRAAKSADVPRAKAFVTVFGKIFDLYQRWLVERRQIDFHDMIIKATEHVETGRYKSPFGYILVDEFQDISPGRARLLKALLDQSRTAQLFAVGDDWQAIYRFAGSDIAIMRGFRERFGKTERIDLGTTFRCVDRIAATATKFVLKNAAQIHKEVSSVTRADGPCVHVGLPSEDGTDLLKNALAAIATDAKTRGGKANVLLLGRYRHSRPENLTQLAREHPSLQIDFKTVHRSKGLEADYVVVLGLCSGKYGFPAEIADDPILDIVLAEPEGHPNAEERRLLYVAVTRARRRAFLLADGGPPSSFVLELIGQGYDVTVFGRPPEEKVPCPKCVAGRLERRDGSQGSFYGCSNWPYCDRTQPACPHCGTGLPSKTKSGFRCLDCDQTIEACPRCDGWLQSRTGKYGPFLGCTNWPVCDYTRDLRQATAPPAFNGSIEKL